MTITMSQTIKPATREKAANIAKRTGEKTAIVLSRINDKEVQMLAPVSKVEQSEHRDSIEVVAVIDQYGQFAD